MGDLASQCRPASRPTPRGTPLPWRAHVGNWLLGHLTTAMGAAMDAAVEATMQELKILPAVLEEAQHRDPPERRYTANNPFVLSDILEVIPKLQPSSPGVDGWQVSELKALGEPSFKRLAKLYHSIESTAVRPGNLLEVPVTTSKKGAGETPLQVCPISLTSHVYRIYGLRYVGHNFSLGIFHGCQMNCMVVFPIGKQWTLIFRLLWILNKPNSSIIHSTAPCMITKSVSIALPGKFKQAYFKIWGCPKKCPVPCSHITSQSCVGLKLANLLRPPSPIQIRFARDAP